MKLNPEYLKRLDEMNKKVARMEVGKYAKGIAIGGAAAGMGKTLVDDIDDDATTLVPNMAAGAGLAVGGAYAGKLAADFIENGEDTQTLRRALDRSDATVEATKTVKSMEERKLVTMSDISDDEIRRKTEKFNRFNKVGRGALAVGALAFGAATVLDVNQKVEERRRVEDMKREQEKRLVQRDRQESQWKAEQGYGNINLGEMVFQMFEERIGHHKMGNAKFQ